MWVTSWLRRAWRTVGTESPMLDVVFIVGIIALIAVIALVGKGVERL